MNVPTTDIARAKAFYGETLGLTNANALTHGPQVIYRCGGGRLLEVYERPTGRMTPAVRRAAAATKMPKSAKFTAVRGVVLGRDQHNPCPDKGPTRFNE